MKYCKHLRFINISVGALTLVVGLLLVGCNSSMTGDDRDKISTLKATEEFIESDELFWEDCEYYWNVLETFYPLCLYPAEDYDYTEIKQSMQTKVKGCENIGEFVDMLKGVSAFFNY